MIVVEAFISLLILIGAFFLLVGSLGLVKLPDLLRRLHAPTKATTLGIGSMLVASMLYFWIAERNPSFHELLITLFLFLTAPVTAQMISKAYILRDEEARKILPDTGRPVGWATVDAIQADKSSETAQPSSGK